MVRPQPSWEGSGSLIKSIVNNFIFSASQLPCGYEHLAVEKCLYSTSRAIALRSVLSSPCNVAMFDLKICVTLSNCLIVMHRTYSNGWHTREFKVRRDLAGGSASSSSFFFPLRHCTPLLHSLSLTVSPLSPFRIWFHFMCSPAVKKAQRWWPWRDESLAFLHAFPLLRRPRFPPSSFSASTLSPLPPIFSQAGQRDEISGV